MNDYRIDWVLVKSPMLSPNVGSFSMAKLDMMTWRIRSETSMPFR